MPLVNQATLADWRAIRRQQDEVETAGAPHGRCECGRALVPASIEGTYCPACLWADVLDYGNDG